jgi:hypothetical protein
VGGSLSMVSNFRLILEESIAISSDRRPINDIKKSSIETFHIKDPRKAHYRKIPEIK